MIPILGFIWFPRFLEENVDPNEQHAQGWHGATALMEAAYQGNARNWLSEYTLHFLGASELRKTLNPKP